jgi:hypothetical protein
MKLPPSFLRSLFILTGAFCAVSCIKFADNPAVVKDTASATPGRIPPLSSGLRVGEVCFGHANEWVWVEGYPAPRSYNPSRGEQAIRLYSEPGRGSGLLIMVGDSYLEPVAEGGQRGSRIRTAEGVVADAGTRVVALGRVKSVSGRDGECSLEHVSDVRLP